MISIIKSRTIVRLPNKNKICIFRLSNFFEFNNSTDHNTTQLIYSNLLLKSAQIFCFLFVLNRLYWDAFTNANWYYISQECCIKIASDEKKNTFSVLTSNQKNVYQRKIKSFAILSTSFETSEMILPQTLSVFWEDEFKAKTRWNFYETMRMRKRI